MWPTDGHNNIQVIELVLQIMYNNLVPPRSFNIYIWLLKIWYLWSFSQQLYELHTVMYLISRVILIEYSLYPSPQNNLTVCYNKLYWEEVSPASIGPGGEMHKANVDDKMKYKMILCKSSVISPSALLKRLGKPWFSLLLFKIIV